MNKKFSNPVSPPKKSFLGAKPPHRSRPGLSPKPTAPMEENGSLLLLNSC